MSIAEKLTQIAENIPEVFEAGKKAEWDEFMDSFQNGIYPDIYEYRFSGCGWNDDTFKPKHSIHPTMATSIFRRNRFSGDMVELFKRQGITLDFSGCTAMTYAFYECSASRIGVIDCSAAGSLTGTFGYMYGCHTIDEVILSESNTFAAATSFRCPELVEIRISGTIGQNGFDIHWSTKLSKDSILSIIKALSSTTSGLTVTLPVAAVNAADWTNTVIDGVTYNTFEAVSGTKSNWTIKTA